MSVRSFREADLHGKKVLVRVDFNVPLDGSAVRDDNRIRAALPTIQELLKHDNALILVSHLGRPKGEANPKYSLKPVAGHLAELLGFEIGFAGDVVGESAQSLAANLQPGQVLMLENVRFEAGEEKNDPDLAQKLAALADVYVNDAFGTAHRAHASTVGIADFLPAYAGDLMLAEIEALQRLVTSPREGFVAIVGGAKVSDKIGVLENLVPKVSSLIVGGGMANTFLLQQGLDVGNSLVEINAIDDAARIRSIANEAGTQLLLPTDAVVATGMESDISVILSVDQVPDDQAIFDIGPDSTAAFRAEVATATTIFWNGPMGVFERPLFAIGTGEIADAVANSNAFSVVGGGDSVAAIEAAGLADRISHISTGGGASLEFVEGRVLPGIAALERSQL